VQAAIGGLRLHVALEFGAGWTVIFGPSGSGKSSLLRSMCGLLGGAEVEFSRGQADGWERLDGVAPERRGLGYAPQGAVVFPHLTVRENVAFGLTVRGGNTRATEAAAEIDTALEMFGLGSLAARMPGALSGGERQRVSLARAFATPGAKLVLLDEPLTGVDREMREILLVRMAEWARERGVAVVSVTHDVEEALRLGAEVVRLEAGRVVAQGQGMEVLAAERASLLTALNGDGNVAQNATSDSLRE
jgi:molybdate transport system ATP-binding protein